MPVDGCDLHVSIRRAEPADAADAADAPVVVILHGQFGVGALFRTFAHAIDDDAATVVLPDLRGRGQSRCDDLASHSWSRLVDDVIAVIDHVGASRAVLAGSSMGAGLALATALREPARVAALVVWALPYAGNRAGWLRGQRPIMQAAMDTARAVLAGGVDPASLPPRWQRHDARSIAVALVGLGWVQPFDDVDDLRAIACPTGVAPGSDDLHPAVFGERCLDVIPSTQRIDDTPAELARFVAAVGRP